ncbi:MAG: ATPase domain-containing protein [Dongiaceae bacterium]
MSNPSAPPRSDPALPPPLARHPTGIGGLDIVLRGGYLAGGIHLVLGEPGAGKTILGNQLCFNHARAGGRALFVTLLAESHARMLSHIGELGFFDAGLIPGGVYYISALGTLERDGLPGLLDLLRREMAAHRATLLVLDGLVSAAHRGGSDIDVKKFIQELQVRAGLADCAIFLLTSGGRARTAELTMVDAVIELRNQPYGWQAQRDLQVLKRRGAGYLAGRHGCTISDAGLAVHPRIEAQFAAPTLQAWVDDSRLSIGVASIDAMLCGGLPRNSSTVLLGPPGSGKTTLCLQFLAGAGEDEPSLYFGFYEPPPAIRVKAATLGLVGFGESGPVALAWQPATEGMLDEICARLLAEVERRRVRRLVIDGMNGLERLAVEPPRLPAVFTALSNELRARHVTTIYTRETAVSFSPAERLAPDDGAVGGLSSIAENIVLLRYVELRSLLYRLVSVLKVRDSAADHRLRIFDITGRGIVVDPDPARAEAVVAALAGRAWSGEGP